LLEDEDLEAAFVAGEFYVADDGDLVGCARLRSLDEDTAELASVCVRSDRRGQGIGSALVEQALADAGDRIEALCLDPGFFATCGFEPADEVHDALEAKIEGLCAGRDWRAMVYTGEV